jgi:hypothetical protein
VISIRDQCNSAQQRDVAADVGAGAGWAPLRKQLANGPKPGSQIEAAAEAAEIPTRFLIRTASALGVRAKRGQSTSYA